MTILVLARSRKARTRLLLVLPVTIGMVVLCISCGAWLRTLWLLLPQISHFYPQTLAALLAGLIGMGLATVLALGSLARAAFALRALSAASPKQESGQGQALPLLYTDQLLSAVHGRGDPCGRPGSVPKGWAVLLVVLLLLFVLPWPLLLPSEGLNFLALLFTLVTWCLAGVVGLIAAWLVKPVGKKQAERAPRKPRRGISPLVWAVFLLILLVVSRLMHLGPPMFSSLLFIIAICVIPALVVKIRISNQQADRTTEPQRNALSPKVWILVSPVLFLVFYMQVEYIFLPDYPNLGEVFIAWLLTGLASLIILLALKLGSRASTHLPTQEALQQIQVQG